MDLAINKKQAPSLGAYRLLNKLQEDSFGTLYRAIKDEHSVLLRTIAPEISNNENFIIRFELLKSILPAINHDNLVKVLELGVEQNIYYLAKDLPEDEGIHTLAHFHPNDTPDKHSTLRMLFEGIAKGLSALEKVRDGYHKEGIIHSTLSPANIYITFKKSLIGNHSKLEPKIDGFCEPFLFFGEGPFAPLQYHISDQEKEEPELFALQHLYPSELRKGKPLIGNFTQYLFGALLYQTITGMKPKGVLYPVVDIDPSLDPLWGEVTNRCLEANFKDMDEVCTKIQEIATSHNKLAPEVRKFKESPPPKGMSLVMLHEKSELGANNGLEVEQPRFRARIQPFFIDIAPVSCSQFQEFMPTYQRSSYARGDDHPAVMVSWHEAVAYCRWRSKREGLPPDSYRLPTEYEWEAAVRGTSGQQYPWGEHQQASRLRCGQPQNDGTTPTRYHPPGRFGLYDMLGNCWEWTQSPFQPHPFSKADGKEYSTSLNTVKGGCWYTPLKQCRASLRAAFKPTERRGNIGFRCVQIIDDSEH